MDVGSQGNSIVQWLCHMLPSVPTCGQRVSCGTIVLLSFFSVLGAVTCCEAEPWDFSTQDVEQICVAMPYLERYVLGLIHVSRAYEK